MPLVDASTGVINNPEEIKPKSAGVYVTLCMRRLCCCASSSSGPVGRIGVSVGDGGPHAGATQSINFHLAAVDALSDASVPSTRPRSC
jgi:hypothetical protein